MPLGVRSVLAAGLASVAGYALFVNEEGSLAGCCLAGMLAVAAQKSSLREPRQRVVGVWETIARPELAASPVRWSEAWLTVRHPAGACVLLTLTAFAFTGCAQRFASSPYEAVRILALWLALLPLWCSGGGQPEGVPAELRKLWRHLEHLLRQAPAWRPELRGRQRATDGYYEEFGIRLQRDPSLPGFIALEWGNTRLGSRSALGLRLSVVDGSASHRCWPRGLVWAIGRGHAERTTCFTPRHSSALAAARLTLDAIERLETLSRTPVVTAEENLRTTTAVSAGATQTAGAISENVGSAQSGATLELA
jgi:hypothetical protein